MFKRGALEGHTGIFVDYPFCKEKGEKKEGGFRRLLNRGAKGGKARDCIEKTLRKKGNR